MQEQLRSLLKVNDQEWSVMQRKIDRIQTLQRERDRYTKPKPPPPKRPDRNNGPDSAKDNGPSLIVDVGPNPDRGRDMSPANTELAQSYISLATLASSETNDSDVATANMVNALAEYRAARQKSDAELAQARDDLRDLVTPRQEVILVVMGILN